MPMGTAPDVTATFDYTAAATSAAAIKALLGTAAGKNFRVDPEHVLVKCASGTTIIAGTAAGPDDILLDIFSVEWLFGRIIDITALKDLKAIWVFRKAFTSAASTIDFKAVAHLKWSPRQQPDRAPEVKRAIRDAVDRSGLSLILTGPVPTKTKVLGALCQHTGC